MRMTDKEYQRRMLNFAKELKVLLVRLNISQTQLAYQAQIAKTDLSSKLNGRITFSLKNIMSIVDVIPDAYELVKYIIPDNMFLTPEESEKASAVSPFVKEKK